MSDLPPITTGLGVFVPSQTTRPTSRTRPPTQGGKRTFRGYAVLDNAGNLAWATFRPTEGAALAAFHTWNPTVTGHPLNERAVPITVILDDPAKSS